MDELRARVTEAGFEIERLQFLNGLAVPADGSTHAFSRRVMPRGQLKLFKWIMPLLKLERKPPRFGLSLLALARRRVE
jgi:hypothetical protein